ncbi:MAG: nuclear transport factor 2 family protein [Chlorobi bacterium]|jgi:Ketosteroid isomerase-related protein|nr:MAG: nuclear transport factor 2 family protein [Bacteroidota bacterium]KXK34637.1 MAG: SnoaL-like domain protein [Chlorobi bacterium OLB6]MBL1160940.1 nuclear transport factor 2 family protein [Chlorobiota bacterium]MBW7852900.1 nuclear transport factor 2 family protein [Candidatus Kapabacteria bacterium]MCC6330869.1 nuclear transport factor 2 family protein [Ignavibacteria bacterium]
MKNPDLKELFAAVDASDADAFASYFTSDGTFRFGNADPVSGIQAVRDAVAGFFASIKSLKHDILVTADTGNVIAAHGYVTYTRHNDTTLRVPVCSVLHMDNGKIKEYFVFIDASQLYNS